ncbi:MAG: acetate--CoA ligase [Candidatus Levyibacteriota bacterium]
MNKNSNIIHKEIENFPKKPNLINYDNLYNSFSEKNYENEIDFFENKKLNASYNLIDRYAKGERRNKVALYFEGEKGDKEKYTYTKLKKLTDKFSNVLINNNVKKGDRVFIFLPSIPERHIAFIGILKIGAIAGPLFPAFQEIALLDRLKDCDAKLLITNATLFPRIKKIWKDLPKLEKVIIVERGSVSQPKGENVIYYQKEMEKAKEDFSIKHLKKEDYAYILYTSGTTGKPKGVVHSHYDVLQAILTTKYVLDVQEDDIYWCTADLGWVTGVTYNVLGVLGIGGSSVIYEGKFSPENWYKIIEDYKINIWYTAPTAIRMLMGSQVNPKDFNLSSLRYLASVGEPLNSEAIWWGLEVFGLPFHDTWWQTELGAIAISNYPSMDIKPGSMGKPFPGIIAAIVDDNGKELPDGKEGNLALGKNTIPSLMKEIWKNKEKFNSYFINDWYISGDRAYKDKDGYFWFFGRIDDVINTAAERVGPFEVESALVEYPSIVEAGVIGKPDKVRGEIIKAFIVLKPGIKESNELKEKIKAFVKNNLAGHLYPREIEFIDRLPKTRSGKIMRRVLKAKELGLSIGDTSTLEDF